MNGTIFFSDEAALATFLAEFTGKSTATFEVTPKSGGYLLTFNGGF